MAENRDKAVRAAFEAFTATVFMPSSPIETSGGNDDPPGMEERVKKLEDAFLDIKPVLSAIGIRLGSIENHLSTIEGQLKSMPTLFGVAETMLAINAGIVAVAALLVNILRH